MTYDERQKTFFQQVQPGTGEWLLSHHIFLRWIVKPEPSETLWLAGMPGSGKTLLASIVIDHLEKQFGQSDVGIAFIFCDYKDASQTSDKFKRAIVRQLLHRLDHIPEEIEKNYQAHAKRSTNLSSDELHDALLLTCSRFSRLFLVIDALDEVSAVNGVGESLLSMCKDLSPIIQSLVTSRWTAGLENSIQEATYIQVAAQDQDIAMYLRSEIASKSRLRLFVQKDPAFKDQIINMIVGNCKGMFLVARLHIESIARKPHLRAARLALVHLPTDLDEIYDSALDRIGKQSEEDVALAWRVLSWTVRATKHLTSEELQHALAADEDCNKLDADALIDMDLFVSVCAGLVVFDSENSRVRLVHHTAQEYFEKRGRDLMPNADLNIASTCLRYLSFRETAGTSESNTSFFMKITAYPFLEYAAKNWGKHVLRHKNSDWDLDNIIEKFLNNDACISGVVQIMLTTTSRHEAFSQHVTRNVRGLHLAAHFGLAEMTIRLLKTQNVGYQDTSGRVPLHWASRAGHALVVRLLLQGGGEVDAQGRVGGTALHLASRYGHLEVVSTLIDRGCDVNKANNVGGTALTWAAIGGSLDIATLLVMNGVDVHAPTKYGTTPLHSAVNSKSVGIVRLLLQHKADKDDPDKGTWGTSVSSATYRSDEVIMRVLLEAGASPNLSTEQGAMALHVAANRTTEGPTRLLLKFGANPNSKDSLGRTPLHRAARSSNIAAASVLMTVAQMNAVDSHNNTVLHVAINARAEAMEGVIVQTLLDTQKVDIDAVDIDGWSALTHARFLGLPKIRKILLDAGADPQFEALATEGS